MECLLCASWKGSWSVVFWVMLNQKVVGVENALLTQRSGVKGKA